MDSNAPLAKKSKVAVVPIPPKLMKIVQDVAGNDVSGNVTAAVAVIESKALRALDSYLNCVCIRLF
jgi:hypothetical protein